MMTSHKLAKSLQLDRSLVFALASRIWQALTGPVTIMLVIRFLSEDETGIYYNFAPIIGIQAFFELGLLNVLISQSGHAFSAYRTAKQNGGDVETAAGRLGDLIRASDRWFGVASILFAITAIAFGWYTFSQSDTNVDWMYPLLAIAPLAAITVYVSPSLAILEGAEDRNLVYQVRFYQMLCGSLVVWAALSMGLGVWALVIATGVQTAWSTYLVLVHRRGFFKKFSAAGSDKSFSWGRDVLPIQWRVAVAGLAFHVATQFLAVCIMTFHTSAESGRLGMTLSITSAIQMLAMVWVQTKYPLISSLHGRGKREEAGLLWQRTAGISSVLLILAFGGLIAAVAILPWFNESWQSRFIQPWLIAVLGLGCLANHWTALQAFYVLARGQNPFMVAAVIGYSITTAAVWIAGYFYSVPGVIGGFTFGITFAVLPMYSWCYWKRKANETASV